jgi:hypothetical protein
VSALRGRLAGVATAVAVAVLVWLVHRPDWINYDARYSLLWMRDAVRGDTPDYELPFAPTPHPLQMLASLLALPFGGAAEEITIAMTMLALGALVWLAYRLGAELWSPWVGVLAALVILSRPTLQRNAMIGYQDIAFAALVVWALLLEVRRPRRGWPVLAILAVAGLMRPDGWVLSGLYVLWLWPRLEPRRRAALASLVLVAPLVWAAQDWLVTGNPIHSFQGTSELAGETGRRREAVKVPLLMGSYLRITLGWQVAIAILVGLAFAWRHARGRWLAPVAVAATLMLLGAAQALVGLPLVTRYVITPSVVLALLFALGAIGWHRLPAGRDRRAWTAAGLVALAWAAAWLPWLAGRLDHLRGHVDVNSKLYADLEDVGEAPAVRERFEACGAITAVGHRPVPFLRWWLDGEPRSVHVVEGDATRVTAALLVPRAAPSQFPYYRAHFSKVRPPAGYRLIYENDSWRVFDRGSCGVAHLPRPPGGANLPGGG